MAKPSKKTNDKNRPGYTDTQDCSNCSNNAASSAKDKKNKGK